jgi:predicted nuclease of predicted toxin-antitoxin system
MKFLIDADCPRSIAGSLKTLGHEVIDIRDTNPRASDQGIYDFIKKNSLILITRDTDFGNILRYPVTTRCGIILLRVYLLSVREIISIIEDLLSRLPKEVLVGSLIIAQKGRYRIRKA